MVGTERPFYYLPELHRIRGDLLARQRRGDEAADAYRRAIEVAAGHGAMSPELRAVTRLCLLPTRPPPEDARARLEELYGRFDEGFATPDLEAARAALRAT